MTTNKGVLAHISNQTPEQTLAQITALGFMAERERLAAADAAIDAHGCDLGPDACEECDRLWAIRADAHDESAVCQIALDANDPHYDGGVQHIVAIGDATPICGRDDEGFVLTKWSEPLTSDKAGAILVAPEYPTCGKCSDAFWSGELDG